MEYPNCEMIVEVRRADSDRWTTALFHWNGGRPVFAQFGSEIYDVTEWRRKYQKETKHRAGQPAHHDITAMIHKIQTIPGDHLEQMLKELRSCVANQIAYRKQAWHPQYNKSKKEIQPLTEKKTSEAQLRAVKKYRKKTNRITIDFYPTEEDLWKHIQSQPKKQTYIKSLIRSDIGKET